MDNTLRRVCNNVPPIILDCGQAECVEHRSSDGLVVRTHMEHIERDQVWRRWDVFRNGGDLELHVWCPKVGFVVPSPTHRARIVRSTWCAEVQFELLDLDQGPVSIGSKGRTCSGYAPHIEIETESGWWIADLLPCGDWAVNLSRTDEGVLLEYRHHDTDTTISLAPGQSVKFGIECLIRFSDEARPDQSCVHVQRFAHKSLSRRGARVLPVVYNTWFDRFARISTESMSAQLEAAREIGCEAFVIDAGWFGPGGDDWSAVGDWRENPAVFSKTTLRQFSDTVRAAGLDFGIWIEPERVITSAPVRVAHPDWFLLSDVEGFYYPDLCQPEAYDWVLSEITRIVDAYEVKWLKIDCNFDFSSDPRRNGHRQRMSRWYGILDELSSRFPDLVFEGCASGGLRNDLRTASHFHTNFLSDTVDPVDMIRIGMASSAWLSPGMTSKWAVIYPTGNGWTPYGREPLDTGDLVLSPSNAKSESVVSYHIDFVMHTAMVGVMGLSGNIAGLNSELRSKIARHIEFYKQHREFIQSAAAIPLTPVDALDSRNEFAAVQISDDDFNTNMVFGYDIATPAESLSARLVGLSASARYRVTDQSGNVISESVSGSKLMDGIKLFDIPPPSNGGTSRSRVLIIGEL